MDKRHFLIAGGLGAVVQRALVNPGMARRQTD
jgi:hypothetical protein